MITTDTLASYIKKYNNGRTDKKEKEKRNNKKKIVKNCEKISNEKQKEHTLRLNRRIYLIFDKKENVYLELVVQLNCNLIK